MSGTGTTTTVARAVTDVLQPRNVLLLGMLAIGLASAGDWTGLPWGFLGALCGRPRPHAATSSGSAGAVPGATVTSWTGPSGRPSSW